MKASEAEKRGDTINVSNGTNKSRVPCSYFKEVNQGAALLTLLNFFYLS